MTYTELVAAIESYTENSYPTVDVNTFITQAENRIFNAVNLPDLRANDTGTISAANKYLNVPVDWLATYSLAVIDTATNEYTFLLNKDVNFIRESFPDTDATFMENLNTMRSLMIQHLSSVQHLILAMVLSFITFIILSLLLLPLVVRLGWVIITLPLYFMVHCWKQLRI
jgi:hypothetical protein